MQAILLSFWQSITSRCFTLICLTVPVFKNVQFVFFIFVDVEHFLQTLRPTHIPLVINLIRLDVFIFKSLGVFLPQISRTNLNGVRLQRPFSSLGQVRAVYSRSAWLFILMVICMEYSLILCAL
jgi:hypothetical protein